MFYCCRSCLPIQADNFHIFHCCCRSTESQRLRKYEADVVSEKGGDNKVSAGTNTTEASSTYKGDLSFISQRTLTMFVGVVALHYQHHNGVPQLPQT